MTAAGKWFVMMYSQSGKYVMPLVDEDDNVLLFKSELDAKNAGRRHHFAITFGFFVRQAGDEYD